MYVSYFVSETVLAVQVGVYARIVARTQQLQIVPRQSEIKATNWKHGDTVASGDFRLLPRPPAAEAHAGWRPVVACCIGLSYFVSETVLAVQVGVYARIVARTQQPLRLLKRPTQSSQWMYVESRARVRVVTSD
jgi:hypothetical protein